MRYRVLDSNWDYVFGNGNEDYILGADAVVQAVQTRLKLLVNEWWEDLEDGLPLFQVFIGKGNTVVNKQSMDLLVQRRIEETTGVKGISNFSSDIQNRTYMVNATIETVYGDAEIEVSL